MMSAAVAGPTTPVRPSPSYTTLRDVTLATFALAKLVAKEKVETWVREPFVDEASREPKGRGLRYAVGELLTCTRCLGAWSSLGLVALRVTRPTEARVVTAVLATSALNDWLQSGFSALCAMSDRAAVEDREQRVAASDTSSNVRSLR
jgi:hypothetical protein